MTASWWRLALQLTAFQRSSGEKNRLRPRRFRPWLESLENRTTPTTLSLSPVADNTLYQVSSASSQQLSNALGQHFFVGDTNQSSNNIRRGVIKFDLSAVPAGSTITSATLTLQMSKTKGGAEDIAVHQALTDWGEGTSVAGKGEGGGAPATTNDVTWFFTFFSTQKWTTPGGDFTSAASAITSVNSVGSYQWTGLTADVQQWVNDTNTNFGWVLTGDEQKAQTAKQFESVDNTDPSVRPVLTVDFTSPSPRADLTIAKSHNGNFRQGDSADTYNLSVSNIGAGPTTGAVTVTDSLPTGLSPTAGDNGNINGWSVSSNGQTITATRTDVLNNGSSYPALTLTVSVANNAPASVTNTATVAGGGEVNTTNDSASDPTTITQVADLTIRKSHTGSFRQGDSADDYTLTVNNIGPGPTAGTVTVTDTLPTGLAPTAADNGLINGWSVSSSGQTVTATRSDVLGNARSYPALTLTVSVANNAPVNVTNTATVAGGGEINTANDSASDPTTITQEPDLTISKSHTGIFHAGDSADTYTITVNNVGAGSTDGSTVTVTDTLPAGLTPTAADSGTINGWSVSFNGQTVIATRRDVLASGASYAVLTVTVKVDNNIAPIVTNTATVAGGGEVNTANDSASDPTPTVLAPDLTVSKSHTGDFRQGDVADIYTLTVNNVGPLATAGTVTVMDPLPTGLAPTSADNGIINGWSVSTSGQTVTATRSDALGSGSSYPALTLTVSVANNAPASVTNTATVAGGGEINTANDSTSDPTTITLVADLTISASHTGIFHPGDGADAYTIAVSNIGAGPTDGSRVTVTDVLPSGLVPTAADNGASNGWSVSASGQTITATRSDVLNSGNSYPILRLTVSVADNVPVSVTNTATVAGGGEVNSANNTASDVITVTQLADLAIAISHNANFTSGGTGAYTITITNVGQGPTAAPVTVIDTLPMGLSYAGPPSVNGWTISVEGQTVTATRADSLAAGASFPALTLSVSVTDSNQPRFVDTATLFSAGERNLSNDAAFDIAAGKTPRRRGADAPPGPTAPPTAVVLANVANTFTHSEEYLDNLVIQNYLRLLHRTPAAAEVNSWVGLLKSGISDEQMLAGFTSSAEYYLQAGATDQAWVSALYHDVLGRRPDASEEAGWLQTLASGVSHFNVAFGFAASVERESLVVAADYQRYLGRNAGVSEVAGWVSNLQHGMSSEQVTAAFVASDEFYSRLGSSIQGWLNGAYLVVFQRDPDPGGFSYWYGYAQNQVAGG